MTPAVYNHKAERAVLGAVLRSADAYFSVSAQLRADHFYLAEHQQIFGVVRDICEANQRLKPSLICARLPAANEQGIAVESTIGILLKEAEDIEAPLDFVDIIKADWKQRKLRDFAKFTAKIADTPGKLPEEKLVEISAQIEVITDAASDVGFTTFGQAAHEAVEETAQNYMKKGKGGIGLTTGIDELDALIGPMMPGMLVTVLAPSGHAKTALLAQILAAAASPSLDGSGSQASAFMSMEMRALEIARRKLAGELSITTRAQRSGDVTEGEFRNLKAATEYLRNLPIYFDDRGQMTPEEVVASLRKAKRLYNIRAAGIDHLKLLRAPRANWSIVQTIEHAVVLFKAAAKELGITIIQLAQLTQEATKRDSSWRPRDGDGYGGGALKENSDLMLASVLPAEWLKQREPPDDDVGNNRKIHDKWVSDRARWEGKAEFGALKIRDGSNGDWKTVRYDGPRMLFGERAIRAAEAGSFQPDDEFR